MHELVNRSGALNSVMFSPVEPMVFAVAAEDGGTFIYDIRSLKNQLYSFLSPDGTYIARFNSSGTRLLVCDENGSSQLVVYDLPTRHRTTSTGKVLASLFSNKEDVGGDACCFAGLDDDLVIGGSDDHNLFIWSLPDGNRSIDCTINRSLRVLTGHGDTVNSIRCSSDKSFIVSCADDGVIKLWTASR